MGGDGSRAQSMEPNDGLAAVFGIVSGVSVRLGAASFALTAGLAGGLASALSMATGGIWRKSPKQT